MTPRIPISAVIITLNEEANIGRCLKSLDWAEQIVVVDSGSTDGTKAIVQATHAEWHTHAWAGYGQQKNWAMSLATQQWVFFCDADEVVSEELKDEVFAFFKNAQHSGDCAGASVPRKTWYLGRWILHGGWYPNRLVRLVKKGHGAWTEPAVHEGLVLEGREHKFQSDLLHYTFKDVGEQVTTNIRFARLGAQKALAEGRAVNLLLILLKPSGKFLETYIWKMGFLDGVPGFVISINAAHSLFMKYVEMYFEKNSRSRQHL